MRVVAVSMVKNEADIIEAFCRHTAAVADEHLIFDHASTDGTKVLLAKLVREGLAIRLFTDSRVEYRQSERTTALMRKAVTEARADWVLPLDADEFLQCEQGPQAFRDQLAASREAIKLWMHDYAPHPHDTPAEPNPILRIQHWTGLAKRPNVKVMVPQHCAADSRCILAAGNHELIGPAGPVPAQESDTLWLAHFPARNCAQVISKVIAGELQRLMRANHGTHNQSHYRHLALGGGTYFHDASSYLRGLHHRPAHYWGSPIQWSPPLDEWPRLAAAVLPFVEELARRYGELQSLVPAQSRFSHRMQDRSWISRLKEWWSRRPPTESLQEWFPHQATVPTLADYGAQLHVVHHVEVESGWSIRVRAVNSGLAKWPAGGAESGTVNLGVQAWNADGVLVVLDHYRHPLPHDVESGDAVLLQLECPPPPPGGFLTLNMVVEQIGWFETPTVRVDPVTALMRPAA